MPTSSPSEREQGYREEFLSRLSQRFAVPTPEWPTVRCWTAATFGQICQQIRAEMTAVNLSSPLSSRSLLQWLQRLGLFHPLPTDRNTLYLFETGATAEADPLEILMANKPSGVICYFSAVGFHSLTTQPVGHHHVAELQPPQKAHSPSEPARLRGETNGKEFSASSMPSGSLGKLLFRYQDIPYYFTRRSSRLIPGVQVRAYGPRSQIRITTREQTLLDTLFKPFHCGGPTVAFETLENRHWNWAHRRR